MIDAWTELVATGFGWVCLAAWRALPVFAIVLGLSLLLRRKVPARYHCLLWMLVIARLSDAFDAMRDKAVPLLALTQIVLHAGSDPLAWEEANKDFLDKMEIDAITLVRRWLSIVNDTSESESDWTSVKDQSTKERISSVVARLEESLDQIRQTLQEFKLEVSSDVEDSAAE